MATKSIKYKTLRIIAALIAAVTLFFSGLFACFAVKGAFFYNRYETIGKYTDTDSFRNLMNSVEYYVIQGGEYKSCASQEELAKTSGAKAREAALKERETSVRNACGFLDKSGVEVFVDGHNRFRYRYQSADGTFYYTYDGSFISESEFNAVRSRSAGEAFSTIGTEPYDSADYDEDYDADAEEFTEYEAPERDLPGTDGEEKSAYYDPDEEVSVFTTGAYSESSGAQGEISEALYTVWNLTNGLNYGEKPTDALAQEAVKSRQYEYGDLYSDCYLEEINSLSAVKYAVFYKTTGRVYTNCGVKESDTADEILKKTGSSYVEIYENGKYSVTGANEKTVFPLYGDFALAPDYLSDASLEDVVDKAYFAYDTSSAEGMQGVGLMAYNGYIKASAPHNAYSEKSLITYSALAVVCFLIGLVCCLFCIITAGRTNNGELKIRFFDRVPFAVNLALSAALVTGFAVLVAGSAYYEYDLFELFIYNSFPVGLAMALAPYINYIQALLFAVSALIVSGLIASIVRNIKNKTFFKHTLIYCIITPVRFVLRKLRSFLHNGAEKAKVIYAKDYAHGNGKKFLTVSGAVIAGVIAVNFILLFAGGFSRSGAAFFLGILLNLLIAAALMLFVVCFDRIASGVTEIKLGSLTCNINTRYMPGFMRSTAEDISKIREGLQQAVNQAVKDQAMKTELITNVTHDLKTPLTSIITYVDLLKTEGLGSENAPEYLAVIDDKSQKLKKLVDDLVQASKASSGALDVNMMKLDLCEFAAQVAGEYQEELKAGGIDLVLQLPQESVFVNADPSLLSRVFENLIGNIRKYAMKNTRAFISVNKAESSGVIVFKNMSALPLDDDPDRLTERFYRGDSSRTGEGSGLGLSISKDLCALQGGGFTLVIDGDLFKAIVTLPESRA